MSERLKVCRRCMEHLNASPEAGADLGTYLVATGSGGIELVEEKDCQYRLFCGYKSKLEPMSRTLADVSEVEIDAAIADMLKQLDLFSYFQTGAGELAAAVKNVWRKARENRKSTG